MHDATTEGKIVGRRILIIEIPQLPPVDLNPNRSRHWAVKASAARDYAYLVKMFALNEKNAWQMEHNQVWEPLMGARVTLEFTWPSDRRGPMMDEKNLESAFKSGIDSLTARVRHIKKTGEITVGASILVDDGPGYIEWGPTVLQRGPGERVRITVEELE